MSDRMLGGAPVSTGRGLVAATIAVGIIGFTGAMICEVLKEEPLDDETAQFEDE